MNEKIRYISYLPSINTPQPKDFVEVVKRHWLGTISYATEQNYAGRISGWLATSPHSGGQVVMYRIIKPQLPLF